MFFDNELVQKIQSFKENNKKMRRKLLINQFNSSKMLSKGRPTSEINSTSQKSASKKFKFEDRKAPNIDSLEEISKAIKKVKVCKDNEITPNLVITKPKVFIFSPFFKSCSFLV